MLVTFHEAVNRLYSGVWDSFKKENSVSGLTYFLIGDVLMYRSGSGRVSRSGNPINANPGVKNYKQLT